MVNRAQIHKPRLAAIADRGLSRTLHFREKVQTEPFSLSHCAPALGVYNPYTGLPGIVF